jgi:predicted nucleic acid-binding protein
MILVDTSIWVDHLNKGDPGMQQLLFADQVLCHPLVIGELAVGNLHPRLAILKMLHRLPSIPAATHSEVLNFISLNKLFGIGIGYIDAHLLASVRLTQGALLWTRDQRLAKVAEAMKLAFRP